MSDKQGTCLEPAYLAAFLDERLSELDESTVVAHLNECTHCQRTLESIAANIQLWDEAQDIGRSAGTPPLDTAHRDQVVESVMEFLGPTDDPTKMGRLGAYEICGIVGRGSTGVVLKAFDQRLHRYVAMKLLAPNFASHGAARARFEREARAVAAVAHEHVIPIYAVDEFRNLPYLVMQFVGGGSLQQRINIQGPLEPCEVARIGMQVASGLAAAHAQGIVHRDVKPANVMLESGVDRAMVTDFGLARVVDDASVTRSGAITGTPQFMSPEQAKGEFIDHRSDLFSLGSLMYTAITGRPPFRSETVYGVIRRVCETEMRPIREIAPGCPEWLAAFVDKLCKKDREQRFQTAREVRDLLSQEVKHLQSPTGTEPDRAWWVPTKPEKKSLPKSFFDRKYWRRGSLVVTLLCGLGLLALGTRSNLRQSASPASSMVLADLPVFESRLTRAVPVEALGQLQFAAGVGNVSVCRSEGQQLDIWVTRKVFAANQEEASTYLAMHDLELLFDEDGVMVETIMETKSHDDLNRFGEFEITVFLPEGYEHAISTIEDWEEMSKEPVRNLFGLFE